MRWTAPAGAAVSLLIGAVLVSRRLGSVDESWWIARDDAVITFSHARNLVEAGSIGVSHGDRVEGFSSPVQFLLAATILTIRDTGYRGLNLSILAASVIGFTLLTFLFLRRVAVTDRVSLLTGLIAPVVATVVVMIGLTSHWTALGWVASGMENAPAVMLIAAIAASFPLLRSQRVAALIPGAVLGTFAVARVEFAAFIGPLLLVYAHELLMAQRGGARHDPDDRKLTRHDVVAAAFRLSPALVIPLAVHLARRWYFGSWMPNTAVVQERVSGLAQLVVLAVFTLVVGGLIALVLLGPSRTAPVLRLSVLGSSLVAGWLIVDGRAASTVDQLLMMPGLYLLGSLVVVLVVISRRLGCLDRPLTGLFLALTFVPVAQFMVTGPARLDPHRVLSLVTPILLLWAAAVAVTASLHVAAISTGDRTQRRTDSRAYTPVLQCGAVWIAVAAVVASGLRTDPPRVLNYNVATYTRILESADDLRERHLSAAALPIVAGPDLGKVTYRKEVLFVDLGWLGDPLLTRLHETDPELAISYLTEIAKPDLVALHHGWACGPYRSYLESDRFVDDYLPSDPRWLEQSPFDETCPAGGRYVIWQRQYAEEEYALVRAISEASDPVTVVEQALVECTAAGDDPLRCQSVRRAAQRSIVTLRESGNWDAVVDVFVDSPSARLDEHLLRRARHWDHSAAAEVTELLGWNS